MINKEDFYATDPILIDSVGNTRTQDELRNDRFWSSDTMGGNHLVRRRLAFHHVLPYCKGNGIDIGCMANRLQYRSIGIEKDNCANYNSNAHGPQLIGDGGNLYWFKDKVLDYVFASHSLEDFEDTVGILREWWRVIKPGGHLIVIMPHAKYYPRHGTPGANPDHKHDFLPEMLLKQIDETFPGEYNLLQSESFDNNFEFDIVIQKKEER